MHIQAVELVRIRLPFSTAFRSSLGVERERDVLLVHVIADDAEGWGECAAMSEPLYTSEYVDGAQAVLREHLVPRTLAADDVAGADIERLLRPIKGHRMAKAALEMAVLDAELRASGESLAQRLGATRESVECGVVVGIRDSVGDLLEEVELQLERGYRRIKLKIARGWDLEPVAAARELFGESVTLAVDANGAYGLDDAERLAALDDYALGFVEEPLHGGSLVAHAELARVVNTALTLDESIVSAQSASDAIVLGAGRAINVKAGRVGGIFEAQRVHDACMRRTVAAFCGGMFDTGIGRAANLALAGLPGFTLPSDISPSGRHFEVEITSPPARMHEGRISVPDLPGLGVTVLRDVVDLLTTGCEVIR